MRYSVGPQVEKPFLVFDRRANLAIQDHTVWELMSVLEDDGWQIAQPNGKLAPYVSGNQKVVDYVIVDVLSWFGCSCVPSNTTSNTTYL
jgi:hypothetical protein